MLAIVITVFHSICVRLFARYKTCIQNTPNGRATAVHSINVSPPVVAVECIALVSFFGFDYITIGFSICVGLSKCSFYELCQLALKAWSNKI